MKDEEERIADLLREVQFTIAFVFHDIEAGEYRTARSRFAHIHAITRKIEEGLLRLEIEEKKNRKVTCPLCGLKSAFQMTLYGQDLFFCDKHGVFALRPKEATK